MGSVRARSPERILLRRVHWDPTPGRSGRQAPAVPFPAGSRSSDRRTRPARIPDRMLSLSRQIRSRPGRCIAMSCRFPGPRLGMSTGIGQEPVVTTALLHGGHGGHFAFAIPARLRAGARLRTASVSRGVALLARSRACQRLAVALPIQSLAWRARLRYARSGRWVARLTWAGTSYRITRARGCIPDLAGRARSCVGAFAGIGRWIACLACRALPLQTLCAGRSSRYSSIPTRGAWRQGCKHTVASLYITCLTTWALFRNDVSVAVALVAVALWEVSGMVRYQHQMKSAETDMADMDRHGRKTPVCFVDVPDRIRMGCLAIA